MKASYNTVTSDIRSLVKQTWVTHVPFAVLLAIVLYFLLPNKSLHDWEKRIRWLHSSCKPSSTQPPS